jgi:hypothetical protein
MSQPTIAANLHQALNVGADFAPQVTLYYVIAANDLAQTNYLVLRKIPDPRIRTHTSLL